jgi:4-amino-4-deoxy-L-arabinose transferase-like glycosyltransferase
MRLWGVALLLVTVVLTWLLAGVLFGGRREAQVVAAVAVGMQPVLLDVTTRVTPDALLIPLCAAALYLMVLLAARGFTWQRTGLLVAVLAAACFTQGRAIAFVLPGLFAIGLAGWRRLRPPATTRPLGRGAVAAAWVVAIALLALGFGLYASRFSLGDIPGFWSYLWQFYLPKLPFQGNVPAIPKLPAFDIWIKGGWGAFGWLEVRFPNAVYVVLALVTVALLAGALVVLVRRRRRADLPLVAFFAVATLSLLAGLHWIEYRTIDTEGVIFNQGRYLLPLLPLLGASAAATLTLVPAGWRMRATGVLIGGACVLQFFSLALIVGRFYA